MELLWGMGGVVLGVRGGGGCVYCQPHLLLPLPFVTSPWQDVINPERQNEAVCVTLTWPIPPFLSFVPI
jgi:hypothetical protein